MKEIIEYIEKVFEDIMHIDEGGNAYWLSRELQVVLDYKKWQKFINVINVINDSIISCEQSNQLIDDHFTQVGKMVELCRKIC